MKRLDLFSSRTWLPLSLLAALAIVSVGCGPTGPQRYPVSGTVTFDGTPVEEGEVIFYSTEPGGHPDAGHIADGKFAFDSLPGLKRVEITATREGSPLKMKTGIEPGEMVPKVEQYLPARFNRETELEATVDPSGSNDFKFALDSK
ncbi:hypothetical protein [Blastopirellula marina]|uniref:hypothetical protein n=1 Tax=Blastopirellula marina TaxID=124 RepID=UPI0011B0EE43|nr:hypothetical protein [Blastopirellula marina]